MNGGKRPGAGRKKASHTIEAEAAKAFIVRKVSENLEPIIMAQIAKAIEGDTQAFKELMDRGWGRPAQPLTGENGSPLFPLIGLAQLADQTKDENR